MSLPFVQGRIACSRHSGSGAQAKNIENGEEKQEEAGESSLVFSSALNIFHFQYFLLMCHRAWNRQSEGVLICQIFYVVSFPVKTNQKVDSIKGKFCSVAFT